MALTVFIGVLALTLLVAGKIPAPRPLRFARVFRVMFFVFLLWGEPLRSLRLNENDAYQLLRRAIKVEPVPGAAELDLTVFGENAEMPATFANRIASVYAAQGPKRNSEINIRPRARRTLDVSDARKPESWINP